MFDIAQLSVEMSSTFIGSLFHNYAPQVHHLCSHKLFLSKTGFQPIRNSNFLSASVLALTFCICQKQSEESLAILKWRNSLFSSGNELKFCYGSSGREHCHLRPLRKPAPKGKSSVGR